MTDIKAITISFDAWNNYECFSYNGVFKITDEFKKHWVKVGHFSEVEQLLDKLKGEENDNN